ncbi:MAG: hypothetical protein ACM3TN_06270 [Alphaproteobacteria bacterium]
MAEHFFYYFLALNLAAVFVLVCGIIAAGLRSREERRKRERARGACSELIRLKNNNSMAQRDSMKVQGYDFSQPFHESTLDFIKKLQTELNQQVIELEKER